MKNQVDTADNLKITVIIPTREHCETLPATIQTCVGQDYENLEILISDNFSQDETKSVVDSFRDKRIRYINTGRRLNMSHNWEFALAHATGDYVTILGDDDGLLPGAISSLALQIMRTGAKAITWRAASYYWPTTIKTAYQNLLVIPLVTKGIIKKDTKKVLEDVLAFRSSFEVLPYLYRGIASMESIMKVKSESGGVFFHSMNPDVYSTIALASAIDSYYYSDFPYSLIGESRKSNGVSYFNANVNGEEAAKFVEEANIPVHHKLVMAPSIPILVAESFFQAQDRLCSLSAHEISVEKLIDAAMREAKYQTKWRFNTVKNTLKEIAKKNGCADETIGKSMEKTSNFDITELRVASLVPGVNIILRRWIIDGRGFDVENIYQASLLCGNMLNARAAGLRFSLVGTFVTTGRLIFGSIKFAFMKVLPIAK